MGIWDGFLGGRESFWFEKGAAGARNGKFHGHTSVGGRRVDVLGTSISREGLAFLSPVRIADRDLPLAFALPTRSINSRVRIERGDFMEAQKRTIHRYFCTFTAIAADDWDAVVRYVDGLPEPPPPPPPVNVGPDDAFRSLPQRVQTEIVDRLVRMKRLAAPRPGHAPMIRIHALPARTLNDGRTVQDVRIHSRIIVDHQARGYDTRFKIYGSGIVELVD
ncbi:MAG TPA: hypothetical protein VGN14_13700 [Candidatus Elarobacter sp.]|jgi:hypothetical protein